MRTPLFMSAAGLPLVVAMMSMPVQAAEFVVTDIGFNGLQRLTPDSLYPVLPITVGDTVNDANLAASIKALYATENFADIQSRIEGGKLRFDVVERPTIAEVNFDGITIVILKSIRPCLTVTASNLMCALSKVSLPKSSISMLLAINTLVIKRLKKSLR